MSKDLGKDLLRANKQPNRRLMKICRWWAVGLRLAIRRWRRATTRRERIRPSVEIFMRLAIFAIAVYLFFLVVR